MLFLSDVDSTSFERYMYRLGNDITSSNYMIASKSGSTFETKDGMLRVKKMLENEEKLVNYLDQVKTVPETETESPRDT